MTNLGPLTTAFAPAPNCTSRISGIAHTETIKTNSFATSTTYKHHSLGPENTTPYFLSAFRVASDMFYSPGICPQGWTSACGSVEVVGAVTETRATCCPLGYTCMTTPLLTATWSTLPCVTDAISVVDATLSDVANQKSRVVQIQHVVNAAAVNVRLRQNDFTAGATGSNPTTPLTSPSSTGSSPADPAAHELSTDTQIGIGVGIGIGGLVLLGATILCIWHVIRRRNRQGDRGEAGENSLDDTDPAVRRPRVPSETWAQWEPVRPMAHDTHELHGPTGIVASARQPPPLPAQAYTQGCVGGSYSRKMASGLP